MAVNCIGERATDTMHRRQHAEGEAWKQTGRLLAFECQHHVDTPSGRSVVNYNRSVGGIDNDDDVRVQRAAILRSP